MEVVKFYSYVASYMKLGFLMIFLSISDHLHTLYLLFIALFIVFIT